MEILNSENRRKIVVFLLRVEGVSILFLGIFLIFKGLVNQGKIDWFVISGILGLSCVGGFGLLLAAKGFQSKKMYGRAPTILANLIAIGVSKYMYEGGLWWAALPLTLVAAVTIYCAVTLIPTKFPK